MLKWNVYILLFQIILDLALNVFLDIFLIQLLVNALHLVLMERFFFIIYILLKDILIKQFINAFPANKIAKLAQIIRNFLFYFFLFYF